MTPTLSRRSFVKGGGALVVGFASRLAGRGAFAPALPTTDLDAVDSFIAVHADGTASVKTGRVELGQGTTTGLLLVVAEELDLDVDQLVFVRHDTTVTPNTGGTFGSSSIAIAGPRLRSAAATARQALLRLASVRLGVPVGEPHGRERGRLGRRAERHVRRARRRPDARRDDGRAVLDPGVAPAKPVARLRARRLARDAARRHPRQGRRHLHLRPRRARARDAARPHRAAARAGRVRRRDRERDRRRSTRRSIRGIGDARVVRRGDFLGVVAIARVRRDRSGRAAEGRLRDPPRDLGQRRHLAADARVRRCRAGAGARQQRAGDVDRAIAAAAHAVAATYAFDYQGAHADRPELRRRGRDARAARSCSRTRQDAYRLRTELVELLGLPLEPRSASSTGKARARSATRPSRFDAGEAAAVMSQLAGAPVRLQFMRWDEHGWDNYSPAVLADVRGAVDAQGTDRRDRLHGARHSRDGDDAGRDRAAHRPRRCDRRARAARRSRTPARSTTSRTGA